MKNTNASIRIRSTVDNEGEVTQMDVIEDARYEYKNGKYYIIYEESGFSEMSGATTTLKVEPDGKVWVKRSGEINSKMCYEVGKRHSCVYDLPFGSITMETLASKIDASLTPQGGELDIVYKLDMGAAKSENHLNITIKEKTNEKDDN